MQLPPKYEAALIAYIALYDNCSKETCWKMLGEAIQRFGKPHTGVVYRGHAKSDPAILATTPFFSTSPTREMAELFVEKEWDEAGEVGTPVGHLFELHLVGVPTLRTDKVEYTLTDEVVEELRKLNGGKPIQKGRRTYSFDEFLPQLSATLHELVFEHPERDIEVLVLNGGTFYKTASLDSKGYTAKGGNVLEAWYAFPRRGGRKTRRCRTRRQKRICKQ